MSDDRTIISTRGTAVNIGTELNETYKIDSLIGVGGMGEVFKGHNIQTGDPVAIKIVLPEFARDEMILELFRKEARILNHLNHDAIVRYNLFSIDRVIGRPYLAMEFVDGPSLAEHVKAKPLDPDDFNGLLKRLADGLHRAHAAGVIHRDMSPDNVILPDGLVANAKIIDFGIARSANVGGGTLLGGSFAGKYSYVSPEQLGLFGGEVTPKSDIYSLALVMATAIRGKPIDMSGSQVDVIEKRRVVPPLDDIPKQLHPVLTAMLQPDPAQRLQDMAAVRDWGEPEKSKTSSGTKPRKSAATSKGTAQRQASLGPAPASTEQKEGGIGRSVLVLGALAVAAVGALGGWIFVQSQKPADVDQPPPTDSTPGSQNTPDSSREANSGNTTNNNTVQTDQVGASQLNGGQKPTVHQKITKVEDPQVIEEPPQKTTVTEQKVDVTQQKTEETQVAIITKPPPDPAITDKSNALEKLVAEFKGNGCFSAVLTSVSGGAAAISAFGTAKNAETLRAQFQKDTGIDPKIVVYPVGEDQCDLVNAAGTFSSPAAEPLRLDVEKTSIRGSNAATNKVGEPLTVTIKGINQRNFYFFIVDHEGSITNVSRARPDVIRAGADEATVNLTLSNPAVADGEQPLPFYPILVLAVAAPKPLYGINAQPAFDSLSFVEAFQMELATSQDVSSGLAFLKLVYTP